MEVVVWATFFQAATGCLTMINCSTLKKQNKNTLPKLITPDILKEDGTERFILDDILILISPKYPSYSIILQMMSSLCVAPTTNGYSKKLL